jgi:hypothetical protein
VRDVVVASVIGHNLDRGDSLVLAVPVAVGWPPPDAVPLGLGDPDGEPDIDGEPDGAPLGDPDCGDGEPDCGDGEPDCGDGEPDWGDGELDCGGGLPEPPVGGGGVCGAWLWKIRMAISTASAASNSISSQDTRMLRQPARS